MIATDGGDVRTHATAARKSPRPTPANPPDSARGSRGSVETIAVEVPIAKKQKTRPAIGPPS